MRRRGKATDKRFGALRDSGKTRLADTLLTAKAARQEREGRRQDDIFSRSRERSERLFGNTGQGSLRGPVTRTSAFGPVTRTSAFGPVTRTSAFGPVTKRPEFGRSTIGNFGRNRNKDED